jgi:hypothetical protein
MLSVLLCLQPINKNTIPDQSREPSRLAKISILYAFQYVRLVKKQSYQNIVKGEKRTRFDMQLLM